MQRSASRALCASIAPPSAVLVSHPCVQVGKFAKYAGSNIVEALGATALGMAVGATAPSTEAALVIGPAVMLVFIVFGGLYTNPDDMPAYLKWCAAGCGPAQQ